MKVTDGSGFRDEDFLMDLDKPIDNTTAVDESTVNIAAAKEVCVAVVK